MACRMTSSGSQLMKKAMFIPGRELSCTAARNLVATCTGVVSPDLYASWKSRTVQRLSPAGGDGASAASVASSRAGSGRQPTASWTRSAADRSGFVSRTFCSGMSETTTTTTTTTVRLVSRSDKGGTTADTHKNGNTSDKTHRVRAEQNRTFPAVRRSEQRRLRDVGVRNQLPTVGRFDRSEKTLNYTAEVKLSSCSDRMNGY